MFRIPKKKLKKKEQSEKDYEILCANLQNENMFFFEYDIVNNADAVFDRMIKLSAPIQFDTVDFFKLAVEFGFQLYPPAKNKQKNDICFSTSIIEKTKHTVLVQDKRNDSLLHVLFMIFALASDTTQCVFLDKLLRLDKFLLLLKSKYNHIYTLFITRTFFLTFHSTL